MGLESSVKLSKSGEGVSISFGVSQGKKATIDIGKKRIVVQYEDRCQRFLRHRDPDFTGQNLFNETLWRIRKVVGSTI